MDGSLTEVSRVNLVDGIKKDAHDLLGIGSRAWALDNVAFPIWIAALETCPRGRLDVTARNQVLGPWLHLLRQFVDTQSNLWLVVESSFSREGKRLSLGIYDAATGDWMGSRLLTLDSGVDDLETTFPEAGSVLIGTAGEAVHDPLGVLIQSPSCALPSWVIVSPNPLDWPQRMSFAGYFNVVGRQIRLDRLFALPAGFGSGSHSFHPCGNLVLLFRDAPEFAAFAFKADGEGDMMPVEVQFSSEAGPYLGQTVKLDSQ